MSENRYGEKREESETGMKLQNCETQESENKIQETAYNSEHHIVK